MSFSRWHKFILMLVFTNILSIVISISFCLLYINLVIFKKEKNKYLEFLKQDGQIFTGVVIPNNILSGDNIKDCVHAKSFLTNEGGDLWRYIRTEDNPFGYQYQVFIFEALPTSDRLATGNRLTSE